MASSHLVSHGLSWRTRH